MEHDEYLKHERRSDHDTAFGLVLVLAAIYVLSGAKNETSGFFYVLDIAVAGYILFCAVRLATYKKGSGA